MNATTYGLDVAKGVFQMYWVDGETGEIVNRRFRRDELIEFLAQRPAGWVALEEAADREVHTGILSPPAVSRRVEYES